MAEQSNTGAVERRRVYPDLSFITVDADCKPWEARGLSYFDVPAEEYDAGCLTGTMVCCELVASPDGFSHLTPILKEALPLLVPTTQISRRGAAVGLLCTLEEVLRHAAAELDLSGVFKQTFVQYQRELADELATMKKDHARLLNSLPKRPEPAKRSGQHRKSGKGAV